MTDDERLTFFRRMGPQFLHYIIELNRILHRLDIEPEGLVFKTGGTTHKPFMMYGMRFEG